MKPRVKWVCAILLAACGALGAFAQPAPAFPPISGTDLNGRSLMFPADFSTPCSLVLIPFDMHQQADVDSWRGFVQDARKAHPSLAVFELPTIARGLRVIQFLIANGMRSGIPDRATRAATVPVFTDVAAFARDLGVPTTREMVVLVVAPSGGILARATGRYAADGAASIERVLNAVP